MAPRQMGYLGADRQARTLILSAAQMEIIPYFGSLRIVAGFSSRRYPQDASMIP